MSDCNSLGLWVSLRAANLQGSFNPFCKVTQVDVSGRALKEVHCTQADYGTDNPNWNDSFPFRVRFGEVNRLRFEIFDNETSTARVIGKADVPQASLLRFAQQSIELAPSGTLTIDSNVNEDDNSSFYLKLSASRLKNMDFGGTNDPFYILNVMEGAQKRELFRSEVLDDTANPRWRPKTFNLRELRDGAVDKELLFQVFDEDNLGRDLIGERRTCVTELMERGKVLQLTSLSGQPTGLLAVEAAKITSGSNFFSLVRSGLPISVLFGIDFGRSTTQYHAETEARNEFLSALKAIGPALEPYDADNRISVYGFGANPQGGRSGVWDLGHGEVSGIAGVVKAYQDTVASSPVAEDDKRLFDLLVAVRNKLELAPQNSSYFVLVLITDGRIRDLRQCKDVVIELSRLPISVVIVGVGSGNFKEMAALDSDAELIASDSGAQAERDIVQFGSFSRAPEKRNFVLDVLSEVPQQMSDYFLARNR